MTASCNFAGEPAMTDILDILKVFSDNVDCIVDEGVSKGGIASTIIRIKNKEVCVLREGPISKKEIEEEIRRCLDI